MRLQLRPGIVCLCAVFVLAFLLAPTVVGADPHAVQIEEVMAGAFGRLDLQFVELRLDGCHGDWGDGARLAFFDAAGNPMGTSNFPADTALLCNSVLIATQAYADLTGLPDPDFLMPPSLAPGSGKVCFENPTAIPPVNLCLSYGSFTGDSDQGSAANAPALVPTRTCSLRRQVLFDFFGNPNFNEDFGLAPPFPRDSFLSIPLRFSDVARESPFAPAIEALFNAGVTGGCGNGVFCPGQAVTREQMAVLLLRSLEGPAFVPPACTSPAFGDVPCSSPFARWINELAARGITGGCGGGNFCPGAAVSREQMAVFLLLAREGTGFTPPACTSPVFGDVPCSSPFAPWVNELAARGITGGCGDGTNFCPGSPVTREQMAVFLAVGFDLPVPSFNCSDGPPPPENPGGEDDHGDNAATATPILPGLPVAGISETSHDRDFFSFEAQEGELYRLEAPIAGGSDNAFLLIFDAEGEEVGPDFAGGRMTFRAPAGGTFFISVSAFLPGDPYELRLLGPIADDHGHDRGTATPLPLNVPTAGEAEEMFDEDFFAFEVEAGRTYVFEVVSRSMFTPAVVITDAAGQQVVWASAGFSFGGTAMAIFQAPLTGTLFAQVFTVFSFELGVGGPGPYEVVLRGPFDDEQGGTAATAAALAPGVPTDGQVLPGDVDVFSFTVQAGEVYLVEATSLSPHNHFTLELLDVNGVTVLGSRTISARGRDGVFLTAPQNGTFFARVQGGPALYRIKVHGPLADDHGDTPAAATPLPGDAGDIPGALELPDDVDVFSFAVTTHDVFLVELTEFAPDHWPVLQVLDADGNLLSAAFRRVVIKSQVSRTLFVRVEPPSFAPRTGAYRIRVRPLTDDHGDWATEATLVVPGSPAVPGAIDFEDDVDVFAFDAVQGQVHTIRIPFSALGAVVGRLVGTDGVTPLGDERLGPLRFTAPATGRFFLRVRSSLVGATYSVTVGAGVTP